METCKHSCRGRRPDARWMLRLLMLLFLHCCREGAVAQSDQLDETTIFFFEPATASMLLIPVTTHTSMAVTPTVSTQPFSSSGGRTSSTVAASQPQPSSFEAPSSTVLATQVERSPSILQSSGSLSQTTFSLGIIVTTTSLRTSVIPVPSSSQPSSSPLLPVASSTQTPAESPSTTSVESSSPLPSQPSTSPLLPVASSTQTPAESPSTTSVESSSPLPSQASTTTLPPAEVPSTTSVESSSPLPLQPSTSPLLPVPSSTQTPAESPSTTSVESSSPLPSQASTTALPPAEVPSTTSVESSSPLPLQPSTSPLLPVPSSTQTPAEVPSTTSVESSSPLPSQPSSSPLLPVASSTQTPAESPSTTSVESSSPLPSQASTTTLPPAEVPSTTSVESSSPLPLQPSTSPLLPVESSTQPPVESPSTTSVNSPSPLLLQSSTSILPPVLTSPAPEPSTTSITSTEASVESTSSPELSSPSVILTTVIAQVIPSSLVREVTSTATLTTSARDGEVSPSSSVSETTPPSIPVILPVPSTLIQIQRSLLPSATPSPTGGAGGGTPTTVTTDTSMTTQESTSAPSFFTLPIIIGISVGGAVIAILLLVILILCCCCCICSHVGKSRRYSMQDSAENPTSIFANGQYPLKRRESNGSMQAYELNFIQMENPTYEESENHLRDPISQVSPTGTDLFHETSLPGLSPLSYMGIDRRYQLSVDHPNEESLSDANLRSSLLGKFPHSSPSLAVPTRMALSLEKEETKSSHGSRTSIPGSSKPPSYQSSKASILGSKHSIQSSRSSFLNTTHSRDDMKPLFFERQNSSSPEDDFLTARFSGRTGSPFLKGDTMESPTDDSLIPTRDSPRAVPLATSHALKERKKDFASLTCIPNHQAIADEFGLGFLQTPLSESTPKFSGQGRELSRSVPYESHAPESSLSSPHRKSGSKINLGALTTLEQERENETAKPTDAIDSAIPRTVSEPVPKTSDDSKAKAKKESPKSSPAAKKPKSRAMSKLEKLTSLDYIRASLRLKKKKVSFEKTPETAKQKSKKKKPEAEPELVVFANKAAGSASGGNRLESPTDRSPVPYQEPKPDAQRPIENDVFSPDIYPEDFGGGFQRHYAGRPRVYSDMHGVYPQLSQPTYFPGHMGSGQYLSTYPQLSQQYYPQLSQGAYYPSHHPYPHARAPLPLPLHSLPPQPSHVHQTSGGSGGEPYGRRYSDAVIPGAGRYPDMVTPDAYLPPNHDRFRDIPSPDRFTDNSSIMDQYHGGTRSPDRFTETSNTSERYQATSPDAYLDMPGRYRDSRSPDRWTDSSYSNSARYDEPISPTRFAPERFIDDRRRGSKDHSLGMDSGRQRHNNETRLLETFDGGRRHSLETHNRYPHGADSGWRNGLQMGQPDRPGRDADHMRQHSSDSMDRERIPSLQGRLPDRYSDGFRDQDVRSPGRYSTYSDTSTSDKFADTSAPKGRVSWSTEVIEYPRTPSPDMEYGSDIDAL